ncbi:MAG: hypothetical protein HFJ45_09770 [Clostridia bacterium]|nr:hypothetical protein [Clostridia bacterium]
MENLKQKHLLLEARNYIEQAPYICNSSNSKNSCKLIKKFNKKKLD